MTEARFCDQCGVSLIPLEFPHVRRECNECGKTMHLVEPGAHGEGIEVRQGDKFTIPAGWISLSLDPRKSRGRFARHGLSWFVRVLITGDLPRRVEGLPALLEKWEGEADRILQASEKVSNLDLGKEGDFEKAIEVLKEESDSVEWWALLVKMFVSDVAQRMESNETAEAALSAFRAACTWSMLVFRRDLEEYVWTGYEHRQLIYGIASAASQNPAEADAIKALQPMFENLDEITLHTWVESGASIGPRIGVTTVDEDVLKALANYHLSLFERQRRDREIERDYRSRAWGHLIAGAGAGAAITTALVVLLKAIGIL